MKFRFVVMVMALSRTTFAQSNIAPQCGMDSCPRGRTSVFCRPVDRVEVKWGSGRSNGTILKFHVCTAESSRDPMRGTVDLNIYVGLRENAGNGRVDINVEDCSVNIAVDRTEYRTFKTGEIQFNSIYPDTFALESRMRLWRMSDPDQGYVIESRLDPRYETVFRTSVPDSGQVLIECKVYADNRERSIKSLTPSPK